MPGSQTGRLFSEVYCERGEPDLDSKRFRKRIGYFCQRALTNHHPYIADAIKLRTGEGVPVSFSATMDSHYYFEDFFLEIGVRDLRDIVAIVFQAVKEGPIFGHDHLKWLKFVKEAVHQENLGYRLDDECGLHYHHDAEFQHNMAVTLKLLDGERYCGVRAAFEDAHRHIDADPVDTKAAVRSMFESIEIQKKLMVGGDSLAKWAFENTLKDLLLPLYEGDETAKTVAEGMLKGVGHWVNSLHSYRHGQTDQQRVAPPLDMAIYILSSGSAFLRWLIDMDDQLIRQEINVSADG